MRTVFIHLKTATAGEVRAFLEEKFPSQYEPWVYWAGDDPCLYIDFYNEAAEEFSDSALADIKKKFGAIPSTSLMVDVSGRHHGHSEVRDFISLMLGEFDGLVQDDWSERFWTLDEVFSESVKIEDGTERAFFYRLAY